MILSEGICVTYGTFFSEIYSEKEPVLDLDWPKACLLNFLSFLNVYTLVSYDFQVNNNCKYAPVRVDLRVIWDLLPKNSTKFSKFDFKST